VVVPYDGEEVAREDGYSMRYVTIAGVLGMLATQAQAESKTYRLELIPEKSIQACSSAGQTYTVDVSNGVLTLSNSYAPRQFSEPVKSDGTITKSFTDPAGEVYEFVSLGNGAYQLIAPKGPCYYRLVQ
jgi:hypothetical protein